MSSTNVDLIIKNLTEQIAYLSKEKAIYFSLATQRTTELNNLQKENKELQEKIEKLEKSKPKK